MLLLIFKVLIISLIVESITEMIVKSTLIRPLREALFNLHNEWITELITCGYCSAFWVALFVNIISTLHLPDTFNLLNFIVMVVITHRLSNIIHGSIDRYFDTRKDIRYNIK